MKNVRWTDNVCTVGDTCVHGYFSTKELLELGQLCPEASFTPTFFHERLGAYGFSCRDLPMVDLILNEKLEQGWYITFDENKGRDLLNFFRQHFPMHRGEGCG